MLPAEEILEAALKLEPQERARLVAEISATLEGLDLGNEWEDEIAHRVEDLDTGRASAIPGEEVFAHLDRRFGEK
jgi:putative addiction module component (TIGR02574 family)